MPELWRLTATAAQSQLRTGRISVEALAQSCLERIAAREPELQAWACVEPEQVLRQAQALDRAEQRRVLHGLPIGIKDILLTHDLPTQYNSPLYAGFRPGIDAAAVRLLRTAGALILGKTTTVEFGAIGRKPPTRNPHNLAHTPGGSSSGSAAAVADSHVPWALCTQTGGSTIRPASFCGVYAMKPTWGLVSAEGSRPYAPSLDTIGWCARSVDDLALLYELYDPDRNAPPPFKLAGARIAICRSPSWDLAAAATRNAMELATELLRGAGAQLTQLELPAPFEQLVGLQSRIMRTEARASFWPEYQRAAAQLDQTARDQVENTDGTTRAQLCEAYDVASRCRTTFDRLAGDYDVILTPSAADEAPVGLVSAGHWGFNAMWSLLHTPCINVPGFHGPLGLPVGLTLTAGRFSDRRVLAAAQVIGPLFASGAAA